MTLKNGLFESFPCGEFLVFILWKIIGGEKYWGLTKKAVQDSNGFSIDEKGCLN